MIDKIKVLSDYKKEKEDNTLDILVNKEGIIDNVVLTIDKDKYKDLLLKSGYTEKDIEMIEKEKVFFKDTCKKIITDYLENNPDIVNIIIHIDGETEEEEESEF